MYNSKKLENPDRNEIGQTANLTNQLSREDHKPRPKSGLALAIPHWVKQKNFTRSLRLPKSHGRVSQSLWFVAISLQISIIHQNILRSLTCLYAHSLFSNHPHEMWELSETRWKLELWHLLVGMWPIRALDPTVLEDQLFDTWAMSQNQWP